MNKHVVKRGSSIAGQYLQAHVVDDGFPASAKEYQASVHTLGLPIWALVEEIYAAVFLLLQPAHHRRLVHNGGHRIYLLPAQLSIFQVNKQACCHLMEHTWQHGTIGSRESAVCKQEDSCTSQ